jgi:hypothetical protein
VGAAVASAGTSWHIAQRELTALKVRRAEEAAALQVESSTTANTDSSVLKASDQLIKDY